MIAYIEFHILYMEITLYTFKLSLIKKILPAYNSVFDKIFK